MAAPVPTPREVSEMRSLVVGREVPAVAHRLADILDRIAAGGSLGEDDRALLARLRHEYGRELAELVDPEGWAGPAGVVSRAISRRGAPMAIRSGSPTRG